MRSAYPVWHRWRIISVLVLLFTAPFLASPSSAQTLKVNNPGTGVIPLDGQWRFHLGDDKAWADPSLDDLGWETIGVDKTWGEQGHPGYAGFAWYRRQIEIDNTGAAGSKHLAILIPPALDAYDVYWNGQKLGSYGGLPPHATWWAFGHAAVFPLPGANGVLAFRFWKAPLASTDPFEVGGFTEVPVLGDASVLAARAHTIYYQTDARRLPLALIAAVLLVIGILSFLLYLHDRRQGLYLWLAVFLMAGGLSGLQGLSVFRLGMTFRSYQLVSQLFQSSQDVSIWLILLALLGMTHDRRWRRATGWIIGLYLAAQVIDVSTLWVWDLGGAALPWIDAITTAVYSITPLYVFVIVGAGLMGRSRISLWPLIAAVCLNDLLSATTNLTSQGVRYTHWTAATRIQTAGLLLGGYFFNLTFVVSTLLFLVLVFTIAREQFVERERQARIELEVKSAREVQQILVPEETPAIPGLSIASVYRPAEEVGGDFFQVIALEGGAALIALGDVSGKGLKAAMTVAMIVGSLRTLSEYTQSPAEILRGLNRRLLGRVDGGFATCLIGRIDPDGETTIANGGHLAPFRDGEELPVAGSLPLGVSADAAYSELIFTLHEGETLTLYTDGILEARNAEGELYGFDRLTALIGSDPTIEKMVEEARNFGQEDDITIFRATRLAHSAPAEAARLRIATQIAGV